MSDIIAENAAITDKTDTKSFFIKTPFGTKKVRRFFENGAPIKTHRFACCGTNISDTFRKGFYVTRNTVCFYQSILSERMNDVIKLCRKFSLALFTNYCKHFEVCIFGEKVFAFMLCGVRSAIWVGGKERSMSKYSI